MMGQVVPAARAEKDAAVKGMEIIQGRIGSPLLMMLNGSLIATGRTGCR